MPPDTPQPQDYNFIVNPNSPPSQSRFNAISMGVRIAIVGGGLLILLILFVVIKNILGGTPSVDHFISITQDQQELIHLSAAAGKQQGLTTATVNSALTTQATIASDQADTITYIQTQGKKVKPETLTENINSGVDTQLAAAAEAGTYDQAYKDVMNQQLTAYANHLQQVYKQVEGKHGRAVLTTDYKTASLLLQQLQVK